MKVIYHCHTNRSICSGLTDHDLDVFKKKVAIDYIFLTDHNTTEGYTKSKNYTSWLNEEIRATEGDVVGLFLTEPILSGLSIRQTSEIIHKQGGLVVAVHPLSLPRRSSMGTIALIANIEFFDIIETYNSRNFFFGDTIASIIAKLYKKEIIFGSDAHTKGELGNVIMEIADFTNSEEFLRNLNGAVYNRRRADLRVHLETAKIKRKNKGR
jgi:predicted metal-dependent phosphoesterase TrpH